MWMIDETRNPWTVLSTEEVYANSWLTVHEHKVVTPTGTRGIYGVISPRKLAIGVVPFTPSGEIVLVGQFRFPLKRYSWEIPEGGGDMSVPPQESAARELAEETGYSAKGWQEILQMDLSNSVSDERAISFIAWDLEAGDAAPDETEELALRLVRFKDALDMVMTGAITDAITVTSLLKVQVLAARGALPEPVLRAL